jgi:glycosyltransferase involved in cell wall biosynthesis
MIRERGIADGVHLLGWRDDVHSLHTAFTLFTMSSRSEGTSVSLLEAMSAGLCPVVTDVGGNGATLGAELAHRLVPAESPEALASAWRAALLDPSARAADAAMARARVQRDFGLDAMVRAYERLYAGEVARGLR